MNFKIFMKGVLLTNVKILCSYLHQNFGHRPHNYTCFTVLRKNNDRIFALFNSSLGALYGPLVLHTLPVSVYRTFL
jgi:hypothetical protein